MNIPDTRCGYAREMWIQRCAAVIEGAGYHLRVARDWAITEFNIACREEPMDGAPELPADQWPDPASMARDLLEEMKAQSDAEG